MPLDFDLPSTVPSLSDPLPFVPVGGLQPSTPEEDALPLDFSFQPTEPAATEELPLPADLLAATLSVTGDSSDTAPSEAVPEPPVGLPQFQNFPSPQDYSGGIDTSSFVPLDPPATTPTTTPPVESPQAFSLPDFGFPINPPSELPASPLELPAEAPTESPQSQTEPGTSTGLPLVPFPQSIPQQAPAAASVAPTTTTTTTTTTAAAESSVPVEASAVLGQSPVPVEAAAVPGRCENDKEFELQSVVMQQFCQLNTMLELRGLETEAMTTCCQVTTSLIQHVIDDPECYDACEFSVDSDKQTELGSLVDLWRAICRVDSPYCEVSGAVPATAAPSLPQTPIAQVGVVQSPSIPFQFQPTQTPLDSIAPVVGAVGSPDIYSTAYSLPSSASGIAPVDALELPGFQPPAAVPSPAPASAPAPAVQGGDVIPGLGISVPDLQDQLARNSMWQVIQSVPNMAQLQLLVEATGNINLLDNKFQPVTLFAPTNDALTRFAEKKGVSLSQLPELEDIQQVIEYHVILGEILIGQTLDQQTFTTYLGSNVTVGAQGENNQVNLFYTGCCSTENFARVIVADAKASSGVFHAIDTVVEPPQS
eukprot:TRINITY_DN7038_c0_g1_i5.p1 TRINITY_DN7038_c0_g1~~TRINITY_DN7038_c0_g1_i5.p1  ORF type:complete len:635 (+),score=116.34 TRINITY_DN7038_c0_g1_i5:129-1907(+)